MVCCRNPAFSEHFLIQGQNVVPHDENVCKQDTFFRLHSFAFLACSQMMAPWYPLTNQNTCISVGICPVIKLIVHQSLIFKWVIIGVFANTPLFEIVP